MKRQKKSFRCTTLCMFCITALFSTAINAQSKNEHYDSVLAKKLHADAYGMKKFVLVLLKTGTANVSEKTLRDSIFHGHMKNIQRLAAEGKLIIAGPMEENKQNYEGVFVFNTESIEEAKQMLATDPAVKANLLDADIFMWYSSAALQEIPSLHSKIENARF